MWVKIITESNFEEEVLKKSWIVLIDFWAEWCGPCQMMLPILADFASDMGDQVNVWKVNVDENPGLAQSFRVMSIPTLIILKDWKPVEQMVWVKQKEELKTIISKYL